MWGLEWALQDGGEISRLGKATPLRLGHVGEKKKFVCNWLRPKGLEPPYLGSNPASDTWEVLDLGKLFTSLYPSFLIYQMEIILYLYYGVLQRIKHV